MTGDAEALRLRLPLLAGTFLIAVAGLVYELLAGTVSSYLLGDSVYQFSLVIGLFMSAMGLGAWLSRHVEALERGFVAVQTTLGIVGGFSAPLLFNAYAFIESYEPFLFLVCVVTGTLIGLEIPLVTRILQRHDALKLNISNVLTADYVGALAAALLFPLVLVPQLGLIATGLLFGLLNLAVAAMAAWLFRDRLGRMHGLVIAVAALAMLLVLAFSPGLTRLFEARLYGEEIVLARDTPYQRLVVTRRGGRFQLYLNGNLQFDTIDEYRYHEALVHPVMGLAERRAEVLVLGGGDGMAVREVLRHPDVRRVTLVDLDPEMTRLFRDHPSLKRLNGGVLDDPRVEIVNEDAWKFLEARPDRLWDVAILDLPDPHTLAVSRLYTAAFYAELARHLPRSGLLATQATSPLHARQAFWSIARTLDAAPWPYAVAETLQTRPYHAYVPSFGEWGFVMAGGTLPPPSRITLPDGLRFLTNGALSALFAFPPDMAPVEAEPNTLTDHPLVRYYEAGWREWFG